jgi:hypothetical protein
MKKLFFAFIVIAALIAAPAAYADVADFEDLTLSPESYWNGSDNSGGFRSGDAWFNNNYNATYGSWDGFAYSNRTDTSSTGMSGQYTAMASPAGGVSGSDNYAVSYVNSWASTLPTVSFGAVTGDDYDTTISGAYFTNNAYAYWSMTNGDSFAKKFGGTSGDDPDWFKLNIKGIDAAGEYTSNTVDFYLADYRFEDNSQDYIIDDWTWVDLTSLGDVIGLEFSLSSSDTGAYGMNTPAYFAMDNLNAVPVPAAVWLLGSAMLCILGIRRKKL